MNQRKFLVKKISPKKRKKEKYVSTESEKHPHPHRGFVPSGCKIFAAAVDSRPPAKQLTIEFKTVIFQKIENLKFPRENFNNFQNIHQLNWVEEFSDELVSFQSSISDFVF
jgi:hypothetical protein